MVNLFYSESIVHWLVVDINPSETYEFVNWDDDMTYTIWKNTIDVPNHNPVDVGRKIWRILKV